MTGRAYMPQAKQTNWGTPPDLFDKLARNFGPFDLDPCGAAGNYVSESCGTYYHSASSGLVHPWRGRVFMNPPYGRGLLDWVVKATTEVYMGNAERVVALLPVRTDTRWWQRYVGEGFGRGIDGRPMVREVRFMRGRLHFVGATAPAPFSSVIIIWELPPGGL